MEAANPTSSSPIALTTDDRFAWVVNRDNNSVSVLEVGNDKNQKVKEIPVGVEPRSIAITPDNKKVYVTNMVSGSVWVINATYVRGRQGHLRRDRAIRMRADARRHEALRRQLLVGQRLGDRHGHRYGQDAPSRCPPATRSRAPSPMSTDNKVYVTSFLAQSPR